MVDKEKKKFNFKYLNDDEVIALYPSVLKELKNRTGPSLTRG